MPWPGCRSRVVPSPLPYSDGAPGIVSGAAAATIAAAAAPLLTVTIAGPIADERPDAAASPLLIAAPCCAADADRVPALAAQRVLTGCSGGAATAMLSDDRPGVVQSAGERPQRLRAKTLTTVHGARSL